MPNVMFKLVLRMSHLGRKANFEWLIENGLNLSFLLDLI